MAGNGTIPMASNGTIAVITNDDLDALVSRGAALLSLLGDVVIIVTVTCVQLRHQPLFTAHILRAMAIADFITSGAAVLNGALIASIGGFVCDLTAILYWYGAWASWMWMAGYAFAINRCMRGAFVSDSNCATPVGLHVAPLTHRVNGALHAACWGVPSLLVVAVYLQSDAEFGPTDDVPSVCAMTTQTEEAFLFFTAMLWLVIACTPAASPSGALELSAAGRLLRRGVDRIARTVDGLWIFARIQWRLCRSVTAATADMAPSVRQAAFRRVTMWPQFLAYIVVFLVSQAPGVVVSSFNWEIPKWLEVLVSALANLHGMLNAVTCTTPPQRPNQRSLHAPRTTPVLTLCGRSTAS
jgi:hypothetical protein